MPLTELSLVRTQSFRIVGAALIAGVAALLLDSGLTARVAPTLTSIAVAPVNPSIGAGQTQAFAATGTFSDSSTRALDGDGAWVAKAGIPGDRMAAAAAVVNGKVYVIGGSTDELNILDTVQEYDPVANSWATKAPLPTARSFLAAAAVNGKIYAIGGCTFFACNSPLATVEEYDPATNTWATKTAMPTARGRPAAVAVDGTIYVVGGGLNCCSVTNVVQAYDPATDTWTSKTGMPTARQGLAAAVGDDRIYVVGGATGFFGNTGVGTLEVYDPATDTWAAKATMSARARLAAAALGGRVYAIGGEFVNSVATVEEYDPATNTWAPMASLTPSFGRRSLVAAEVNGQIYAIGGQVCCGFAKTINEAFTPPEVRWTSSAPAVATIQPSGVATGVAPGTSTITATAEAVGDSTTLTVIPALSIADASVTEVDEGTTAIAFTVTLSAETSETVSVEYQTADETATAITDYNAASGVLTFDPLEISKTIIVTVNGDVLNEPAETFFVTLQNPTNAVIADGQATGTILNDDPVPTVSIGDVTRTEPNVGTINAVFTVSLSGASGQTVSVHFATADGTATVASGDYTSQSGTLTIPAGATTGTIAVPIVGDLLDEDNETFDVTLSAPSNATILDGLATGTITDNDSSTLRIADRKVTEGDSETVDAVFTASLSVPSSKTVTVAYATATKGTAKSNIDYVATSGNLTFDPGITQRSITVIVSGDTLDEANEAFFVNLSGSTNATIADAQGKCIISDNDPFPTVSIGDTSIVEGDGGTRTLVFTVTLSGPSGRTTRVSYSTANGSAAAGTD